MRNKKDDDFCERRSRENLVDMYRDELHDIIVGYNCIDLLSTGVRRRLRRDGILEKFGHKYRVTPLGRKMLEVEKNASM